MPFNNLQVYLQLRFIVPTERSLICCAFLYLSGFSSTRLLFHVFPAPGFALLPCSLLVQKPLNKQIEQPQGFHTVYKVAHPAFVFLFMLANISRKYSSSSNTPVRFKLSCGRSLGIGYKYLLFFCKSSLNLSLKKFFLLLIGSCATF